MKRMMFAYDVEGPDGGYMKNWLQPGEASKRSNNMCQIKRKYLTRDAYWPQPKKEWSNREDEDLLKIGGFGVDWDVVSKSMNDRTSCECFLRWNELREEEKKREEEKNREEEKKRKRQEEEERKRQEEEERKRQEEEEERKRQEEKTIVFMLMAQVKELEKEIKELKEKEPKIVFVFEPRKRHRVEA